jgi:hypothetical protein
MFRLFGLLLGIGFLPAQVKPWYGLRSGINWGQYHTKDHAGIRSRAYWGGGFSGAIAAQVLLAEDKPWAIQGEMGITQRRATDRNLLYDYRYNLWSLDLTALGVWRWNRSFEAFFLETGPMASVLVYGKYWERDNLSGDVETRKVQYGRGGTRDLRRGEIAWTVGASTGYRAGSGYLILGLRFWHGLNNLGGGLFQRWHTYGVMMNLIYWYDDSLREEEED